MKILQITNGIGGEYEIVKKLKKYSTSKKIFNKIYSFTKNNGNPYCKNFRFFDEIFFFNLKSLIDLKKSFKNSDITIQHYIFNFGSLFIAFYLYCFSKKKRIGVFHSYLESDKGNIKKIICNLRRIIIINFSSIIFNKIIFLTNTQRDYFIQKTFLKEKLLRKSIVINNFILKGKILKYKKKVPLQKTLHVLFVGRFSLQKGFYDLLDISEQLKSINFSLIGDGKINLKQKNIKDYGKIANNKILEYYDKNNILILPSYTEVFPMTILEAMARGLVILVSDIPGMREIIKEGRNGYLFPPGDTKKIKELILYLKNNPKKIKEISKNNLKDIQKFTAEKQVPKYIKVYNEVLKENAKK